MSDACKQLMQCVILPNLIFGGMGVDSFGGLPVSQEQK